MEKNIQVFNTVFDRKVPTLVSLHELLFQPEEIYKQCNVENYEHMFADIERERDKKLRNDLKREYLLAADVSGAYVLCVDIDDINDRPEKFEYVLDKLKNMDECLCVKKSVSGNIVAYFRWETTEELFPYVYYKLWLMLTMALSINIDFLPELNRLRYVSLGLPLWYNPDASVLTEPLIVQNLPYISVNAKKEVFSSVKVRVRKGKSIPNEDDEPDTLFIGENEVEKVFKVKRTRVYHSHLDACNGE